MPLSHTIARLLFIIAMLGALCNSNFWGPNTLTAYFLYVIPASLLATLTVCFFALSSRKIVLNHLLPLICLLALSLYYYVNGFVHSNEGGINLRHYFMLANFCWLIGLCIAQLLGIINLQITGYVLFFSIIVQVIVCLLQYFQVIGNKADLFVVTGTWVNPNVTAMYLVMTIPLALYFLLKGDKMVRNIAIAALCFISLILILLKCRTALIGSVIITAIIGAYQFNIGGVFKSIFKSVRGWLFISLTITALLVVGILLYNSKASSTHGRQLIWKICFQMVGAKPLIGSGYGQFEHDYNLAQAQYFKQGMASKQEIANADYVKMAYNEFLENTVEGGVIGLLLFTAFLVSLLIGVPKINNSPQNDFQAFYPFAYAGIACFVGMGFFNFTVQAIPVMVIFLFYVAVCVNGHNSNINLAISPIKMGLPFLCISVFLFFKVSTTAQAYRTCKVAKENVDALGTALVTKQLAEIEPTLDGSVFYWRTYGNILFKQKQYRLAEIKFERATSISSDPELLAILGLCQLKQGNYNAAEKTYGLVQYIQPHHFAPRYALMKTYAIAKDSSNALRVAQNILTMDVKVPSEKVDTFKKLASQFIQQYKEN